jgi:hypothetical protein
LGRREESVAAVFGQSSIERDPAQAPTSGASKKVISPIRSHRERLILKARAAVRRSGGRPGSKRKFDAANKTALARGVEFGLKAVWRQVDGIPGSVGA